MDDRFSTRGDESGLGVVPTRDRALIGLAEALHGLHHELDQEIESLRALIAQNAGEAAITTVIDRITGELIALDVVRRGASAAVPADELLALLAEWQLPEPLEERRRALSDLEQAPPWSDVLQLMADVVASGNRPGLLARFFGGQRRPRHRPPTESGAGSPTDDTTEVPAPVRESLTALIDRLVLPEGLAGRASRLRARLGGRLTLQDLAEVIQTLATLVSGATREGNERLDRFLRSLTDRMEGLGDQVGQSRDLLEQSGGDRRALVTGITGALSELRLDPDGDSLERHLRTVEARLEQFVTAEHERHRQVTQQMTLLREQLEATENEAQAMRSSLLRQQLRTQIDPLTQVANREAYTQRLDYEYARWRRQRSALSLLFADVDRFKRINDNHGHQSGDSVLQAIAHRLKASLRRGDLVARYGGEEFVVVMPETTVREAELVAEKLRAIIAQKTYSVGDTTIRVTMSFGVTEFQGADTPGDALGRADRALYEAKRTGRNRVVVAPNEDPHAERR